jgi:ribose-phosphate pyrophosphokinase
MMKPKLARLRTKRASVVLLNRKSHGMEGRLQIFSGNANRALAQEIASCVNLSLGRALVGTFQNGETRVKIEENVRGSDVFVVQPTCTPVNQHIMELLLMIDALRRASAARVTAVIPYYGYAKQEKKTTGREPISAKVVANLIHTAGADRVLTMDLHAPAIEGFFDIPVDHLQAGPLLAEYVHELSLPSPVVVSPDAGGVGRANQFRERIGAGLAIIAKQRPQPDAVEMLEMVGDVDQKTAVIVDDLISTGGTLAQAARSLKDRGARDVYACATHGIFAGEALSIISNSVLVETIVTNTIPLPPNAANARVRVISVAPLFAEAIMRIHKDLSLSALFS